MLNQKTSLSGILARFMLVEKRSHTVRGAITTRRVEGQTGRAKTIKRQMYGRANCINHLPRRLCAQSARAKAHQGGVRLGQDDRRYRQAQGQRPRQSCDRLQLPHDVSRTRPAKPENTAHQQVRYSPPAVQKRQALDYRRTSDFFSGLLGSFDPIAAYTKCGNARRTGSRLS